MKRIALFLIILSLMFAAASAEEASAAPEQSLTTAFTATFTRSVLPDAGDWTAAPESRAQLTARLWADYSRTPGASECPRSALSSDTLVAVHNETGFLFVVIPTDTGRLCLYYVPATGTAHYMWEKGSYPIEVKKAALEKHGMTVWINETKLVEDALAQLGN